LVNRGPGANGRWNWDEIALQAGVGFSQSGRPRSGMGVDAADLTGSGWQDLFVANVDHEMFSVYRLKRPVDGKRGREIVEKLTAEARAKQLGAKAQ
jgi:hypothetical protein